MGDTLAEMIKMALIDMSQSDSPHCSDSDSVWIAEIGLILKPNWATSQSPLDQTILLKRQLEACIPKL